MEYDYMIAGLNIKRKTQVIARDNAKVICRLMIYGGNPARVKRTIRRVIKLDEQQTKKLLDEITGDFSDRHKNVHKIFRQNFNQINSYITSIDYSFSRERELLIGAFFTMEYAIESAALFNPSIVPHPDQSDVPEGSIRFIMSLRAVGEGHISSMVFRSGIIDQQGNLQLDPPGSYVETPSVRNPDYDRHLFKQKLKDMGVYDEVYEHILKQMPEHFSYEELKLAITDMSDKPVFETERQLASFDTLHQLADSNYQLGFEPGTKLSERVIYPVSKQESGGIEDARFVKFTEENNEIIYYATYTAYNGRSILPQLIETRDFQSFKMRTLNGKAAKNKGMALFPRKINGKYAMLSRQDGENNRIMFSDSLYFWDESQILQKPTQPWEFIKIGNCGSPIETEDGWLVLTHGVGAMRTYSIGAILLDLEDPTTIIARLKEPLLRAFEEERDGYVPNVVYTCGYIEHNDQLVIPYSMSDIQPAVARVPIHDLISEMEAI